MAIDLDCVENAQNVEVKISLKQAVQGGVIFGRTEMDGIITSERIPSQYIVSITEDDKVLWSRAESNLEPRPGRSRQNPQLQRQVFDSRDGNDPSNYVAMDDTSTGQPDHSKCRPS